MPGASFLFSPLSSISSYPLLVRLPHSHISTPDASSSSTAPSSIEEKLNVYIKSCKDELKKHGFNLQTEIHQVLASNNIILLKKEQVCLELSKFVNTEYLLDTIRAKPIIKDIKVNNTACVALSTLL